MNFLQRAQLNQAPTRRLASTILMSMLMDPMTERMLFTLHFSILHFYTRVFKSFLRKCIEYTCLATSISLFIMLILLHSQYVGETKCIQHSFEQNSIVLNETDLLQIKIYGYWSQFREDIQRKMHDQRLAQQHQISSIQKEKDDHTTNTSQEIIEPKKNEESEQSTSDIHSEQQSTTTTTREASLAEILLRYMLNDSYVNMVDDSLFQTAFDIEEEQGNNDSSIGDDDNTIDYSSFNEPYDESLYYNTIHHPESGVEIEWEEDPIYYFSHDRGLLFLTNATRQRYNISTQVVTINASDETCFGSSVFQQGLIEHFIGYDTILLNNFIQMTDGKGYLYNPGSKLIYSLRFRLVDNDSSVEDVIITKVAIIVSSLLLFMVASLLASHIIIYGISSLIQLSIDLSLHRRGMLTPPTNTRPPYFSPSRQIIFGFTVKVLVYVVVILGVLSIVGELYDDIYIGTSLLTTILFVELFILTSARTADTITYFPRFFFLFYMLFSYYQYSFGIEGFSTVSFFCFASFTCYIGLFFLHHYEIPALSNGTITHRTPRAVIPSVVPSLIAPSVPLSRRGVFIQTQHPLPNMNIPFQPPQQQQQEQQQQQ